MIDRPHSQPDWQPVLSGEAVLLRPLRAEDWEALYAAASDPAIWAVHPARDRWQEPVFRTIFDEGLASGGALLIIERASGAIIGSSRYAFHDPVASEVEIGWTFLVRRHWGGATNRAVKRLMLDHAFHFVDRVVFLVGAENWRSRGAMEKIGGRLRPGGATRPGVGARADHVTYEIGKTA